MQVYYTVIVKGIVTNKKTEKLLLLKRSPEDPVDPMTWETVGGKIEQDESIEEALEREIYEECGLKPTIKMPLYAVKLKNSLSAVLIAYLCETEETEVILSNEHCDYKWVSSDELNNYISGEIQKDFIKYRVYEKIWSV